MNGDVRMLAYRKTILSVKIFKSWADCDSISAIASYCTNSVRDGIATYNAVLILPMISNEPVMPAIVR